MKKFEVRVVDVYTQNGIDAFKTFIKSNNQSTCLIGLFDSLRDAYVCYNKIKLGVKYIDGCYRHRCGMIEENTYDNNGNLIYTDVLWCYSFPDADVKLRNKYKHRSKKELANK